MGSNDMELDLEHYKDKILNTRSINGLKKLIKTYKENLGISAGDPEVIELFEERRNELLKNQYRGTPPETPESPELSYKTPETPETFSDLSVENPLLYSDLKKGVMINETADNRRGCQDPKDCLVRSLRGLDWVNEKDRDDLVKLIGEAGLSIDIINEFLKERKRNIKLVLEIVSDIDLYTWANKTMKNNTCSIIMLKLKPNDNPDIKYQYHAVIICNQENVIILWDTQRTIDNKALIQNVSKDKINEYLDETGLLDKDFLLVKKESEEKLIEKFKGLKIDNKKNKKKKGKKPPVRRKNPKAKTIKERKGTQRKNKVDKTRKAIRSAILQGRRK